MKSLFFFFPVGGQEVAVGNHGRTKVFELILKYSPLFFFSPVKVFFFPTCVKLKKNVFAVCGECDGSHLRVLGVLYVHDIIPIWAGYGEGGGGRMGYSWVCAAND